MGSNYSKIKIGATFQTKDGTQYKKKDELIAVDLTTGFERYIDPMFDRSIGVAEGAKPDVDTSAKVVKAEAEPESAPKKKAKKKSPKK